MPRSTSPANKDMDLRRGIDHIGVSVCGIIHDGNGHVMLMKRGPKARDEHGRWDICGGALEFGESITDAITRELYEELCAEPLDIKFLTAYDAHRNLDSIQTHWVALVHAVLVNPDRVTIGEPHKITEIGWFTQDSLPKPLHSQFHKALAAAIEAEIII